MKNNDKGDFQILFNFLILISFGMFAILIKLLKQGEPTKDPMITNIPKTVEKPKEAKKKVDVNIVQGVKGLNERQEVIVEYLVGKGEITPKELKKIIPDVSTRTIRRDMDKLVEKGVVRQEGSTKSTFYTYIG